MILFTKLSQYCAAFFVKVNVNPAYQVAEAHFALKKVSTYSPMRVIRPVV